MRKSILGLVPILMILAQLACNLPGNTQSVPLQPDTATPTPSILIEVAPNTPEPPIGTATPVPTPQNPLVLRATLCWQGPGPQYLVVSALKQSERVKLLGRGSISGWYVVENPTYHDLCWVQEVDLQIEPGTDLLNLKVYNPPPKPTPTKIPSITPTPP